MSPSLSPSLPPYLLNDPPPISPVPSTVRLQALYASTSAQRQSNPTGYAANVAWWSTLLEELLRSGNISEDHLVIKVDDGLLGKLQWETVRPKGIGGVIERLATSSPSILHPSPHFFSSPTALHAQASLASRVIGRPLWWAFAQLNPFGGGSEEAVIKEDTLWSKYGKGREYVHMPLLEQAAAALTAHIRSNPPPTYSESLHSIASFSDQFADIAFPGRKDGKRLKEEKLSKRDMEILIRWLGRDCGVIVAEAEGDVIKVLAEGESASDHPITEADKGTVTVRATLRRLEVQIESIEHQIERCQQKAKHHLNLSQKPIALSHLRSKKQLEEILLKRISASNQLESVLRSIDQAQGDIEIMAAYQTSTSTLKGILENPLLDIQEVERTTDELAEVMANQEEVDSAIRLGGEFANRAGAGAEAEVDEDELKRELDEMVAAEQEQEQEQKRERQRQRERSKQSVPETNESRQQEESAAVAVRKESTENKDASKILASTASAAPQSEDEDATIRLQRYEDAQQRQREERARAEAERMRRADKVAAE